MQSKPMHPPSESTAAFIRVHLLKVKKDYPYNMWRLWKQHLNHLNFRHPTYASFRKYVYVLKRAKLIRKTSSPSNMVKPHGNLRPLEPSFYELVPHMINNNNVWANPQVAIWGEKMRYGKRKYRRKILGLPPSKRGRKKKHNY